MKAEKSHNWLACEYTSLLLLLATRSTVHSSRTGPPAARSDIYGVPGSQKLDKAGPLTRHLNLTTYNVKRFGETHILKFLTDPLLKNLTGTLFSRMYVMSPPFMQ